MGELMALPFTDEEINYLLKRIQICKDTIIAIRRKRSWRDSEKAMAQADYMREREMLIVLRKKLIITNEGGNPCSVKK